MIFTDYNLSLLEIYMKLDTQGFESWHFTLTAMKDKNDQNIPPKELWNREFSRSNSGKYEDLTDPRVIRELFDNIAFDLCNQKSIKYLPKDSIDLTINSISVYRYDLSEEILNCGISEIMNNIFDVCLDKTLSGFRERSYRFNNILEGITEMKGESFYDISIETFKEASDILNKEYPGTRPKELDYQPIDNDVWSI